MNYLSIEEVAGSQVLRPAVLVTIEPEPDGGVARKFHEKVPLRVLCGARKVDRILERDRE